MTFAFGLFFYTSDEKILVLYAMGRHAAAINSLSRTIRDYFHDHIENSDAENG